MKSYHIIPYYTILCNTIPYHTILYYTILKQYRSRYILWGCSNLHRAECQASGHTISGHSKCSLSGFRNYLQLCWRSMIGEVNGRVVCIYIYIHTHIMNVLSVWILSLWLLSLCISSYTLVTSLNSHEMS